MWHCLGGTMIGLVLAASGAQEPPSAASREWSPSKSATLETLAEPRDDEIAAVVNGSAIPLSEVDRLIRPQLAKLFEQIDQLRLRALDRIIASRLMEEEAARRGLAFDQLYEQVTGSVPDGEPPQQNPDLGYPGPPLPLDLAQGTARYLNIMTERRKAEALQRFQLGLRRDSDVRIFLQPQYQAHVTLDADDDPVRGDPQAPVTIIEFGDYQCSHCRRMKDELVALLEAYPSEVRLVFRDFPVNNSPESVRAAQAAECARDQGKFWEYHDRLLGTEGRLDAATLHRYAEAVGLDMDPFQGCLSTGKYLLEVQKDKQDGLNAGVSGTPSFFVNGRMIAGSLSREQLRSLVDLALSQVKSAQR